MQQKLIFLFIALLSCTSVLVTEEYNIPDFKKIDKATKGNHVCQYPTRPSNSSLSLFSISSFANPGSMEIEPNDNTVTANPAITSSGQNLDVSGNLTASDVDSYRLETQKGDVIGIAVKGNGLDTVIGIYDAGGEEIISNDDHSGVASFYPDGSPLPSPTSTENSALTWIAPKNGTFFVVVKGFDDSVSGDYTLEIRSTRPFLETQPRGTKQIIFLDFNGATINSQQLFGQGKSSATLSPMIDFLTNWQLTAFEERQVADVVIANIEQDLNKLKAINPNADFEIRNSFDHPDEFGLPHVSRVIIGGTIQQIGFPTIGIASSVDPGNFETQDTAVVLLDLLSAPSSDPNSINSLKLKSGFSKIEAVGFVIAKITAHEIGHFLGCWHTNNENSVHCTMDQGGDLLNSSGIGRDKVLGSNDDKQVLFAKDAYIENEGIATGSENTDIRAAYALSKGK
ncbi:hypothetical protein [Candidatus Uabimicrobium sp. HlEnr_7]|uniref:hypothetical protein n=1 Tax=Candidatus Uabimicrobium helgolandensis TaxID=3095367 RepID=UPI0035560B8D